MLFDNLASYRLVVNPPETNRLKLRYMREGKMCLPRVAFADRPRSFSQILGQGAMASPMVALKGPLMNKRDYSLTFALKHALKDMRFALGLGVKVRYR